MFFSSLQERSSVEKSCGLCLLPNRRRPLPCSHTFCMSCLNLLIQRKTSGSFPCPTCLSPTDVPPGGVEDLQNGFNWKVTGRNRSCPQIDILGVPASCPSDSCFTIGDSAWSCSSPGSSGFASLDSNAERELLKMEAQERTCHAHPEELLRFYCTLCHTPICRDCKLSSHEGHRATDLQQQSREVKSLLSIVMEMSRGSLEPKLRESLQEVKSHQKVLQNSKKQMEAELKRRAQRVKDVVDETLKQTLAQLDKEVAKAERLDSTAEDDMTKNLGLWLSFHDHVQSVIDTGCNADVVELLPELKQFFPESGQHRSSSSSSSGSSMDDFEVLENCTPGREICFGAKSQHGVLRSFLADNWKVGVELSESSSMRECPFCSCRYSARTSSCPRCRSGSAPRTPAPRTLFGLRGRSPPRPQLQCQNCCHTYNASFEFCPSCGLSPWQDVLSNISILVPQYLGQVRQNPHHQQHHQQQQQQQQAAGQEGNRGRQSPRVQEIFNVITTISKLLHEWQ